METLESWRLGLPRRSLVRWPDRWYVGERESTLSADFRKMDPKANLKESLPLSDGEATKTLGGSGAFCFITWK